MARPKPWISRIPRIRSTLQNSAQAKYTRRDLEEIFRVGRSAASELMHVAGMSPTASADQAPTVSRDSLLNYLQHGPEGVEHERRVELARKLQESEEARKLKAVRIGAEARDEWTRLQELRLMQIEISEGLLVVEFSQAKELLHKLWLLSRAIGNDFEGFERMCQRKKGSAA